MSMEVRKIVKNYEKSEDSMRESILQARQLAMHWFDVKRAGDSADHKDLQDLFEFVKSMKSIVMFIATMSGEIVTHIEKTLGIPNE